VLREYFECILQLKRNWCFLFFRIHDVYFSLIFRWLLLFLPVSVQRFRFNVRRVVKKGKAANAATDEAIAAARAAADAVAHAAGIELRAPWEVAADEEELARMLRLSVREWCRGRSA
jgi:hypothetical protein